MKTPRPVVPGDHVFAIRRRTLSTYSHHGIFLGSGEVAHFSSQGPNARSGLKSTVQVASIADFRQNDRVTLRWYTSPKLNSAEGYAEALQRTRDVLTSFAHSGPGSPYQYNVFTFNCEHLAVFCRTGFIRSEQIGGGLRAQRNGTAYAFVNASQSVPVIGLAVTAAGLAGSFLRHRRERPGESFFRGRGIQSVNWAQNLFEGYGLEHHDVPALFD
ncbi:lecithin retinol acyltransferase family protein [Uniformispora flossi]|uniref:lecithin retinol acyltransferase family protein n=1 Tax=Uniformispora flossi TaxID=3390723 RepID=UPI003C2B2297